MSTALDRIVDALQANGQRVAGNRRAAQCPAHADSNPSLSIGARTSGEPGVVVHCMAGCQTEDVLAALGLTTGDLFDAPRSNNSNGAGHTVIAEYTYVDDHGNVLYVVERRSPKAFRQRRPDGHGGWIWNLNGVRRVLYNLPAVLAAVREGKTIYNCEGEKDADALTAAGVTATTCPGGAGKWRAEYADMLAGAPVVVVADRDEPGRAHAVQVAASLAGKAKTAIIVEAATGKDAADHLAAGHSVDEFVPVTSVPGQAPTAVRRGRATLDGVYATFLRWLGADYDLDVLDAVLCAGAAERLPGDPCWLLVVSGSGAAKTETVQALAGAGAHVTSTISSEGALLSGTAKRERSKDATGGLLRKVGDRGLIVVKDVTSILSMQRDSRAAVLAALREVYDGRWERNLGSDGGQTLTWTGRLVVVGAVTTAWDRAHSVISAMGDRFVVVRLDSTKGRERAGRQSIGNTGAEEQMRAELACTVGGLLDSADPSADLTLTDVEVDKLLGLADLVTLTRTGVDHDYRGDVIDAHAPEMPTRFAKQLAQIIRGGLTLGMDREHAMRVAVRCAADSMPPLRLAALLDVEANPASKTGDVRVRMDKPRATVDRTLQALHMLGLLMVDEIKQDNGNTWWHYSLDPDVNGRALEQMSVARNVRRDIHPLPSIPSLPIPLSPCPDKSGNASVPDCPDCGFPVGTIAHQANCCQGGV